MTPVLASALVVAFGAIIGLGLLLGIARIDLAQAVHERECADARVESRDRIIDGYMAEVDVWRCRCARAEALAAERLRQHETWQIRQKEGA